MYARLAKGTLRHDRLEQHPLARSTDRQLLDYLQEIRTQQPTRGMVLRFFGHRRLAAGNNCKKSPRVAEAVRTSIDIEKKSNAPFTLMTMTDKHAPVLNHTRCAMDFAGHGRVVSSEQHAVPGDPELAGDAIDMAGL